MLLLFSHPVMSNSLQPHELQHPRPLCPSPSSKVCPSSCPLYRWCHPAISSSDALFSFCPQSFPVSGTFPMSQLFSSDDQNTGVSASALHACMLSCLSRVQPHGQQPTRLLHPQDSPGKNTGVGCHFLLQALVLPTSIQGWFPLRLTVSILLSRGL